MSAADCLDGVPRRCWVVRMFTPTCASATAVLPLPGIAVADGEVGVHGSADRAPNPPHDEGGEG